MNPKQFLETYKNSKNEFKHLVVFSGGQDSLTLLLALISEAGKDNVEVVTFNYCQTHPYELEVAKKICNDLEVRQHIIDLSFYKQITETIVVNKGQEGFKGVTNRNLMFLNVAWILAEKLECKYIYLGIIESENSIYPDCKLNTIEMFEQVLQIGSDNHNIHIVNPFAGITKVDAWKIVDNLGMLDYVWNESHTCYNNIKGGCSECPACELRNKRYKEYLELKEKENEISCI